MFDALKEACEELCWLRLHRRYDEADALRRDLVAFGFEVRYHGKNVAIGDQYRAHAWTTVNGDNPLVEVFPWKTS
jgi:hypothetical protein